MTPEYSRIFLNVILVLGITSEINFGSHNWNVHVFFDLPIFQFSSKTNVLDHKFEDPSCRICSYGPHGPFWFSVKNRRDMVRRYQENILGKGRFLRLSWKWIDSSGVSSEKLLYVRRHPTGAFIPETYTLLEFWDMPILKKLHFCQYLMRIFTQTLQKTLRKLSGGSQKASPSSLEQLVGQISLEGKSGEFICVFL